MPQESRKIRYLEWASRIIALRRRMGISQSELGKQLNSSAMAVSRWERGVQDPPANIYIQLGNITGDPECWYFWGRAGLHSGDSCVSYRSAYAVAKGTLARPANCPGRCAQTAREGKRPGSYPSPAGGRSNSRG